MSDHEPTDRVLAGLDAIIGRPRGRSTATSTRIPSSRCRSSAPPAWPPSACAAPATRSPTGVGETGVVGVLANGDGPTVMLRADMDALPVKEATGLPYASTATATDPDGHEVPVMHACGHDMHVTWLAGATALLAGARDAWHGTVLAVFQPAEETAQGAQAMIDDGLFDRFPKPEVILGQHVMPAPAGHDRLPARAPRRPPPTASRCGCSAAARTARCPSPASTRSSWPPPTVLRLQTIVSREIAATPGRRRHDRRAAGRHEGQRDPRRGAAQAQRPHASTSRSARHVLDAIKRIVDAEATASGAPAAARDHDDRALPADRQRPATAPPASPPRCAASSARTACTSSPRRSRPARTSAPSAPSGASRRCSGTSAAPTPTLYREAERGRPRRAGHPHQPQPELRPRHPPHAGDRRPGHGHRRRGRPGRLVRWCIVIRTLPGSGAPTSSRGRVQASDRLR